MTVLTLGPETARLPSVPVLTWNGMRVTWAPWEPSVVILCTGSRRTSEDVRACDTCRALNRSALAIGTAHPADGDTILTDREARLPSGRTYLRQRRTSAHPFLALTAHLCLDCRTLSILPADGDPAPVETILCDGCDVLAAAGATTQEARDTLLALGGWTGGADADWDLCPACNPATNPTPPTRALHGYDHG